MRRVTWTVVADWVSHGSMPEVGRSEYLERVRAELAADTTGD